MYMRLVCLHAETRCEDAVRAADELLGRYGEDHAPEVVKIRADSLWLKSRALDRCGEHEAERSALRELIALFGDRPEGRSQVAQFVPISGQLAKSTLLARTGRVDAALLTCEQMLRECERLGFPDSEVRRAQRHCVAISQRRARPAFRLRRFIKDA